MRTNFTLLVVLFFVLIITTISCQKNRDIVNDLTTVKPIEVSRSEQLNEGDLLIVKDYLNRLSKKTKSTEKDKLFDTNSVSHYEISGSDISFYYAPQENYNTNNKVNYFSGCVVESESIKSFVIVKEEIVSSEKKIVTYMDKNFKPLVQITIGNDGKVIKSVMLSEKSKSNQNDQAAPENDGMGACVAKCISSSYVDEGWFSVGLWICTAFCPETAVAVALVCIAECSVSN